MRLSLDAAHGFVVKADAGQVRKHLSQPGPELNHKLKQGYICIVHFYVGHSAGRVAFVERVLDGINHRAGPPRSIIVSFR